MKASTDYITAPGLSPRYPATAVGKEARKPAIVTGSSPIVGCCFRAWASLDGINTSPLTMRAPNARLLTLRLGSTFTRYFVITTSSRLPDGQCSLLLRQLLGIK